MLSLLHHFYANSLQLVTARCIVRPTVFPLIEAGSQIQAGPLIEAGGLISNIIELGPNCTSPGSTVVHTVIRAYCLILAERRYGLPGISLCT